MKIQSGELMSYLRTHFRLYKWINTDVLGEDLNISITEKVVDDNGYITAIRYTENEGGAIISWGYECK